MFAPINGFISDCRHTKFGAPRGLVLRRLFFIIYVPIIWTLPIKLKKINFIDDTYLHNIKDSIKKIKKSDNFDLKFLLQWLNANKISLNIAKLEVIIFIIFRRKGIVFDTDLQLKLSSKN